MTAMADTETSTPDSASLPSDIRVFVNERGVSIPRGSNALDAVRAHSANDATDVEAGRARLTDSRGLPMMADTVLLGGAIMRVLPVRDRQAEANSGAHSGAHSGADTGAGTRANTGAVTGANTNAPDVTA